MTDAESIDDIRRERDEFREHSVALNLVAARMGEALGYPPTFEANPLELVEQLIDAKLQPSMRVEELPRFAMYAVIRRGRFRYLVKMAPGATASFHTEYDDGFEHAPTGEKFTLTGRTIEKRILRDWEEPGTRADLAHAHPTKSITAPGEWPATPEGAPDEP